VAEQGPPPRRPSRQARHRGPEDPEYADRSARVRGDRPDRLQWEQDPFAPDADSELPPWAAPTVYPSARTPALLRRQGRNRSADDGERGFRGPGQRRPEEDGPGYGQPGYDQPRYGQPGYGADTSGGGRADDGRGLGGTGYDRPERASGGHRKPSYDGPELGEPGLRGPGSGAPDYPQRSSSGSHRRPDADELGYRQPAPDRPDTDWRDTGWQDSTDPGYDPREGGQPGYSGEPGYAGQPDYARQPDGGRPGPDGADRNRPRHGRPVQQAGDLDGYDGANRAGYRAGDVDGASGAGYRSGDVDGSNGAGYRSGDVDGVNGAGYRSGDLDGSNGAGYRAGDVDGANGAGYRARGGVAAADGAGWESASGSGFGEPDAGTGASGARAGAAVLPRRLNLPGRVGRGRAAATRIRKSRRRVYRWSAVGIVICAVVALVVVLNHHSPKPLPYVTALQPGEYKSVPAACDSVSPTVLSQYLPQPGRTTADQISGSSESECSFTLDHKPTFLELNVTAQMYQPLAAATAAGSPAGSASANAADNYFIVEQGLAHPATNKKLKSPVSPARITPLSGIGQKAFVAVASEHVSKITSEIVTIVLRERNVLITVQVTGQESGGGFGPVSDGTLEAAAQAAVRNVLAKAEAQPKAV
jgi:hypothetical protein